MLVRQDWRDTFQPGAGELARRIRGVAFAGGMRAIDDRADREGSRRRLGPASGRRSARRRARPLDRGSQLTGLVPAGICGSLEARRGCVC
jgi:hypothetical protein